ncbi:MAG: hypothetical protein B7Y39_04535 [Bdellovibrio sp. 28-41-41]|nr:MAG: hypothetical protein B7Y39_04535 [Bdellovibrio sp. 28-41-41]
MKRLYVLIIILFGTCLSNFTLAQEFDFSSPNLDKQSDKKSKDDIPLGSFGALNLGILFDVRYMTVGTNAPGTVVHVNELNITGNIGDNISILAEQLLPTSILSGIEDQVGDDHGFVYAIFANIPALPAGTAFKIGRFRFKWGIDAVLDAPANPIYPLTRKNIGFITDRGLELAGFFGDLDYTLGIADGPQFIEQEVMDVSNSRIGVVNKSVQNNSNPVFLRLSSKFSSSKIGLSYFDGQSWAYVNFLDYMPNTSKRSRHPGGMADRQKLLYRQHGAIDYLVKLGKLDLALEYSQGVDTDSNKKYQTKGYFSRIDYMIKPQKLSLQIQYDQYNDGRPDVKDEKSLSTGLQIFIHDQAFIRVGYIYNHLGISSEDRIGMFDDVGFVQFYLPL